MNINYIAALCQVSTATVSRVINNSPNVSEHTRKKVLEVMRREDYVPNSFAGGFGRNALKIVAILVADIANLYYATAVSLLEKALRARGFDTLLCCTGVLTADKRVCLENMVTKRVDAIILVGSAYREERDNTHIREAAQQAPVFMLNAQLQLPNVFSVLCNEREAIRNVVASFRKDGVKRILYLHDMVKWAWAGSEKLEGFREGLQLAGIDEQTSVVIRTVDNTSNALRAAEETVKTVLAETHIDGIVTSEDILAIGAQKAALSLSDHPIKIIGFNNSTYAECCTPAISSVDNMLHTLCPLAVDMLSKHLAGERIPTKVLISAEIVNR